MMKHANRFISRFHMLTAALAFLLVSTTTNLVRAHGGGGDIALFSTGGQADIGFAVLDDDDITQLEFNPDESIFQSILLPNTPNSIVPWDFASPEPGFDANEGELPPIAPITLHTLELSYWNGAGAAIFSPATGNAAGYAPAVHASFADGGWHAHPYFGIGNDGAPVADGVYLSKLKVSVDGLIDSDLFYQVSLVDSSISNAEDAEALGQLVRDYLDDPQTYPAPVFNSKDYTYYADAISLADTLIPEPSSMALVSLGLAALLGIRKRD